MDRFKFVGKLRATKDPISTKQYESGWEITRYLFLCLSGDNSQFLSISAGKWGEETGKDTTIYTFAKSEKGQKCEKLNVSWADRLKPEIVEKVAPFKKFIIDLDIDGKDANGDPGKNRREYIHEYDFLTTVAKILSNASYADEIFEVTGNIERSYNSEKNDYFSAYVPTKIRRVSPDAAQSCTGTITIYYTDDPEPAYNDSVAAESGIATLKGYSKFYDGMSKKNGYAPVVIQIPCGTKEAARAQALQKILKLNRSTDVKSLAVDVDLIRGSMQKEITIDDLTQEQKEAIEWGFTTLEDIKNSMNGGGKAYSNKEESIVFKKFGFGYTNGPVLEEDVTSIELVTPPIPDEKPSNKSSDIDDSDLFGDL